MEKETVYFIGNTLAMTNNFNVTKSLPNSCTQHVFIFAPKVANYSRLVSCGKFWTRNQKIHAIVNNNARNLFGLGPVVLKCRRIIAGSNVLWHATLQVSAATTTGDHEPPFQTLVLQLRCTNSNGSVFIKNVEYNVEKILPNKTLLHVPVTQKPATAGTTVTDLPLNSSTTPPPTMPAHGTAGHKNNLAMVIGIPFGIAVAILLGVAWACYRHRGRIIMLCKDKHRSKNNNIEATESIFN